MSLMTALTVMSLFDKYQFQSFILFSQLLFLMINKLGFLVCYGFGTENWFEIIKMVREVQKI